LSPATAVIASGAATKQSRWPSENLLVQQQSGANALIEELVAAL